VKAAVEAFEGLSAAFLRHVEAFKENGGVLGSVQLTQKPRMIILSSIYPVLVVEWRGRFANTLDEALLLATYYDGFPHLPGFMPPFEEPSTVREFQLTYELVRPGVSAYVMKSGEHRTFSPDALAEHLLKVFMDLAEKGPR
jgi:hypothetical protein